ncbi:hypothetical protein PL11_001705 [Lentilactobacillus curieae]|uniref:Uncharacterized protein n=1 Tax=Lentilactobacillus curieae TaxID=1138822 RepID=A0A1S6QGJ5_9LACO|nr:hypothetical protein [Lentilactobacillus curieae]AQW20720.1 hypothetical protein PL11_001705 [Lentilactobacillus curieae]
MLDVKDSIEKLSWSVNHHFLHIKAQHDFIRAVAVQFELAYTDFRTIQMALQLAGEEQHSLLASFTKAYDDVYAYESVFAMRGLDEFNSEFPDKIEDYQQKVDKFNEELDKVRELQKNNL